MEKQQLADALRRLTEAAEREIPNMGKTSDLRFEVDSSRRLLAAHDLDEARAAKKAVQP